MAARSELLLKNGRIIDPVNGIDEQGHLLLAKGKIAGLFLKGKKAPPPSQNRREIELAGKWIFPGFIDMHVHLREPGEEYKETIDSGTKAAAAGGFTAVACMPNTEPVNDSETVTSYILEKAREAKARVYPVGSISKGSHGEKLADYGEMKKAGVVGLSDDGRPVTNSQLMRRALEYSSNFELLIISHSEEISLSQNGVMNEGYVSTKLGLRGIPKAAEEIMIYRDLSLAEYTGNPIHIAHISTKESVSLIRRAKERGCLVTAETAPHYFTLTEEAIDQYNTLAKMNPPLRTEDDVAAIQQGLKDGTIDVIATDHAPHSVLEKEQEFDIAANGIIGLETAVPLTLSLVRGNIISAQRMAGLLSSNPARILGVQGGSLQIGRVADVTVVDPEREFVFSADEVVSKSKNSPFLGRKLLGKAVLTVLEGKITFKDL